MSCIPSMEGVGMGLLLSWAESRGVFVVLCQWGLSLKKGRAGIRSINVGNMLMNGGVPPRRLRLHTSLYGDVKPGNRGLSVWLFWSL